YQTKLRNLWDDNYRLNKIVAGLKVKNGPPKDDHWLKVFDNYQQSLSEARKKIEELENENVKLTQKINQTPGSDSPTNEERLANLGAYKSDPNSRRNSGSSLSNTNSLASEVAEKGFTTVEIGVRSVSTTPSSDGKITSDEAAISADSSSSTSSEYFSYRPKSRSSSDSAGLDLRQPTFSESTLGPLVLPNRASSPISPKKASRGVGRKSLTIQTSPNSPIFPHYSPSTTPYDSGGSDSQKRRNSLSKKLREATSILDIDVKRRKKDATTGTTPTDISDLHLTQSGNFKEFEAAYKHILNQIFEERNSHVKEKSQANKQINILQETIKSLKKQCQDYERKLETASLISEKAESVIEAAIEVKENEAATESFIKAN
ncbi:7039_t:CDS:1, partial [Ambispora gerdemannii]